MQQRITFLFFTLFTLFHSIIFPESNQKPFVVVIPSYNNAKWVLQNLDSVFAQNYENFRVIYIDDASRDGTGELVEAYRNEQSLGGRLQIIRNEKNQGALYNIYYAIHSCKDEEIIVGLDGDDWLAHEHVLSYLNEVYNTRDVWVTYGGFCDYPSGKKYPGVRYPNHVIKNNNFRRHAILGWRPPRTYYAWLFKKIRKEDLMHGDRFIPMAWDWAIMFPMLEMAGERFAAIAEILYVYNRTNPISDGRKNRALQQRMGRMIKGRVPYKRVREQVPHFVVQARQIVQSATEPSH